MKFIAKPYNADFGLLADTLAKGAQIDGVIVDANITNTYGRSFESHLGSYITGGGTLIVDNNLERARRGNFSNKPTYKALSYVQSGLSLAQLTSEPGRVAEQVLEVQTRSNATLLTTPYLYLDADALALGAAERFGAQIGLVDAFASIAPSDKTLLSIAFSATPALDDYARQRIVELANRAKSAGLYLLVFNMDLGNEEVMRRLAELLRELKDQHKVMLLSHAPTYAYCLEAHGITGFASGLNYMMSLDEDYLGRRDQIGGITHNYYLPRRLMKVTPQNAQDLVNLSLIDLCECPYCHDGIPFDTNRIRQHYVFARAAEAREVNERGAAAVREYLTGADELIEAASDEQIALIQPPVREHWERLLNFI